MKRFYKKVEIVEMTVGHQVVLDGKPIKTPAKHPLSVPNSAPAVKPA